MSSRTSRALRAAPMLVVVASMAIACNDDLTPPVANSPPPPGPLASADGPRFSCVVSVHDRAMRCDALPPTSGTSLASGLRADRVVGKQDVYIKLTNERFSFDVGTRTLSQAVSLQNLLQTDIGTTNGSTTTGVIVFLDGDPQTVSGTGTVTVVNADGRGHFTAPNGQTADQPYWVYNEILEPYQISATRSWQFIVPASVASFRLTAYVSAPMVDSTAPLLDAVWDGSATTDWLTAANWASNAVPNATSVVAVPSNALLGSPNFPVLGANDTVRALRVGDGSTLQLGGNRLTVGGNVDAVGTISGGTVQTTGTRSRLSGRLPSLLVSTSAQLQRSVVTTGAVSIDGSLAVRDSTTLVINIP